MSNAQYFYHVCNNYALHPVEDESTFNVNDYNWTPSNYIEGLEIGRHKVNREIHFAKSASPSLENTFL